MIAESPSFSYGEYVNHYYNKMVETYDNLELKSTVELERRLEYHIQRGFNILNSSLKSNSNIYEFILQDFVN